MYKKIFLSLIIVLLLSTPIYAETINWQPVNYSSPDSISENGLSIEEFNSLSKADWLDILGDKKKVNFAFSAADSEGNDITNKVNPNLSINVQGLNNNQTVSFQEVVENDNGNLKNTPDLSQYNKIIHVDIKNGNDTTGDGSENKPFATLAESIKHHDGSTAFIMQKGIYESVNINSSEYEDLAFIGQGLDTIFKITGTLTTNLNPKNNLDSNIFFYNFVWDGNNLGSDNFISIKSTFAFHNVVFKNIGYCNYSYFVPNHNYGFNPSIVYMYNCIKKESSRNFLRTSHGDIKLENCYGAFTSGYSSTQSEWDHKTNIITNSPQLDAKYNILESGWQNTGTGQNPDGSKANIGVYGGPYSW